MKKGKKILALLLALVFVMASMTACGGKEKKEDEGKATPVAETDAPDENVEPIDVELLVWAPQEEQTDYEGFGDNLLDTMCKKFAELHPEYNITFKYAVCAEGDAKTELQKDAAAGADVFMYAGDQTSELAKNGVLYPLTVGVDEVVAGNSEASITAATVDGKLYGIPFSPNSWFMYYDKSKYTEEEVLSLDTMMAKDLGKGNYNFSIDIDNGWYNASFFLAAGCELFGPDGIDPTTVTFNNETGLKVGEYMIDLATNPKFLLQTDENIAISYMKEGKCAAFCGGTWNATDVEAALGENYAATKLPTITIDGEEKQLSSFADYKYIGVNANTKYPEVAQLLAAYLGGEECQLSRFEARSTAPTLTSLAENADVQANVAVAALSLQAGHASVQSTIPQMNNYWAPAAAFGAGIYNKEIKKDNLQTELDAFVDNILTTLE